MSFEQLSSQSAEGGSSWAAEGLSPSSVPVSAAAGPAVAERGPAARFAPGRRSDPDEHSARGLKRRSREAGVGAGAAVGGEGLSSRRTGPGAQGEGEGTPACLWASPLQI